MSGNDFRRPAAQLVFSGAAFEPVSDFEQDGDGPGRTGVAMLNQTARSRRMGPVLIKALRAVVWALSIAAAAVATLFVFWTLVGVVLLRGAPVAEAYVFVGIFAGLAGVLSWVLVRFFSSGRTVGRVIAATVAVILVMGTVSAFASADRALFLARGVIWGESDVLDYRKFPARAIDNAPPVFDFKKELAPELLPPEHAQSGAGAAAK